MSRARREKIGSSLRGALSRIVQTEMNDPRLGFVTVTAVEVSPDLRLARVFVSILGDPAARAQAVETLERARGFLRHRLAESLSMRRTPELRFQLDLSTDRGEQIERLLDTSERPGSEETGPDDTQS